MTELDKAEAWARLQLPPHRARCHTRAYYCDSTQRRYLALLVREIDRLRQELGEAGSATTTATRA